MTHTHTHTHTHTPTITHTHNQLAAANPEIKASVTDVISGYICGRERKRAEQTNVEEHEVDVH